MAKKKKDVKKKIEKKENLDLNKEKVVEEKPKIKGDLKEEKKEDKNDDEKDKSESKSTVKLKQNKQIIWLIVLMLSVILIIIIVPIIKTKFIDQFNYSGLKFFITKAGELKFYSTRVPLVNKDGDIIGNYSLNFRTDPRKINDIVKNEIENNNITFLKRNNVFISIGDVPVCEDNLIAVTSITDFLRNFAALKAYGAMATKKSANETGFPYITCANSTYNTVIIIQDGNESVIKKVSNNCYEITYKDCEIQASVEKFIITILEYYMNYVKK